jgi:hypothetical protein
MLAYPTCHRSKGSAVISEPPNPDDEQFSAIAWAVLTLVLILLGIQAGVIAYLFWSR